MPGLDLLLEAEKRGILPDDKKALLEEARNRGIVPKLEEPSSTTTTTTTGGPIAQDIAKLTRPSLQYGGMALGGLAGMGLGPLGAVGGAGLGYAGGTQISNILEQGLGVRPPQPLSKSIPEAGKDILTGAASQAAGEILGPVVNVGKNAIAQLGRKKALETLNKVGAQVADDYMKQYLPKDAATKLFKLAEQQGGAVPLPQTFDALNKVIPKMEKWYPGSEALKQLKIIQKNITDAGGLITPTELQNALEVAGTTVSKLEASEGSPFGASKLVFKGLADDMNNAPAGQTLAAARAASKRSKGVQEVRDEIANASKILKGQTSEQFNSSQVINKLAKSEWFQASFDEGEREQIYGVLKEINTFPALRPPDWQSRGSGPFWESTKGLALIIGGYGAKEGSIPKMTMGAGLYALPKGIDTYDIIAQTLHYPQGRKLMKELVTQSGGRLTPNGLGVLAAFLKNQAGGDSGRKEQDLGPSVP